MSKYLVVIDMQNDFIDGSLGTEQAQAILPAVIDRVRGFKGPVMFTRDTHDEDYLETQEGKHLPVPHCIKDTDGWQLQKDLNAYAVEHHCLIFDKPSFGAVGLAGCVNGINRMTPIDEIEMIGVCTDICVISNALLLKSVLPETVMTVDASLCAGSTPEGHRKALDVMKTCHVNVINDVRA